MKVVWKQYADLAVESSEKEEIRPRQHQKKPGLESKMVPAPVYDDPEKPGCGRMHGKTVLITGGDSGIGRAVALLLAKEGADIAIAYLREHQDAREAAGSITETYKRKCILLPGDIAEKSVCEDLVQRTINEFGKIDVLINNAAVQTEHESLGGIPDGELEKVFATNILSFFRITGFALKNMTRGASIINTASVTAYRGSKNLIDYSATKGAVVSFTRSLASNLVDKGIRVNAVAPGPVWTPLIVSGFNAEKVATHGSDNPMGRSAEPLEIAPCYLFLASDDSVFMTGQVLHPNGGEIVNG